MQGPLFLRPVDGLIDSPCHQWPAGACYGPPAASVARALSDARRVPWVDVD